MRRSCRRRLPASQARRTRCLSGAADGALNNGDPVTGAARVAPSAFMRLINVRGENRALVSPDGFEPSTTALKVPCSTTELRARRRGIGRDIPRPGQSGANLRRALPTVKRIGALMRDRTGERRLIQAVGPIRDKDMALGTSKTASRRTGAPLKCPSIRLHSRGSRGGDGTAPRRSVREIRDHSA